MKPSVDKAVLQWYSDPKNWHPEPKSPRYAEYKILQQGSLLKDKKVLNLGCFYPEDELKFGTLAKNWVAVDFSPEVITRAKLLVPHVTFMVMDICKLEFPDKSFDVVMDLSSGDHLDDESFRQMLIEVYRVLSPGGHFVLAFANRDYFAARNKFWHNNTGSFENYGYWRAYTIQEMKGLLLASGFQILEWVDMKEPRCGVLNTKKEG